MEWWSFHSKVCKRMGVNSATARLAYRQLHDILYGSLCRLRGAADWAGAMMKMERASDENATTELEIVDLACPTTVSANGGQHINIFSDSKTVDHQQGSKTSNSSFCCFCKPLGSGIGYRDILLLVPKS